MLQLGLGLGLGQGMYFSLLFFFSLLKVTKIFVLHVSGNCDIRGVRTTTVHDVKMMYSQEQYMENVPGFGLNLLWRRQDPSAKRALRSESDFARLSSTQG